MKIFVKGFVLIFCLYCVECAFRCDYSYSLLAKGWFKLYEVPETWLTARRRCVLQGAVLASPITKEIEMEMIRIMKNYFLRDSEIFTGIHASFSSANYYTIDGIPLSEIPLVWAQNEPDNLGNKERCITYHSNGTAADRMCEEPRPYICHRSGKKEVLTNKCGTFDNEYRYYNITNSCYKFHPVPVTFSEAHFTCSAEGGHLVIINSEREAQIVKELFSHYPATKIMGYGYRDDAFIGFHDWGVWGEWMTIHGETLSEAGYSRFIPGAPNNVTTGQSCGGFNRGGGLNDLWCDIPFTYICEKDPEYPPICQPSADEEVPIDKWISDQSN